MTVANRSFLFVLLFSGAQNTVFNFGPFRLAFRMFKLLLLLNSPSRFKRQCELKVKISGKKEQEVADISLYDNGETNISINLRCWQPLLSSHYFIEAVALNIQGKN